MAQLAETDVAERAAAATPTPKTARIFGKVVVVRLRVIPTCFPGLVGSGTIPCRIGGHVRFSLHPLEVTTRRTHQSSSLSQERYNAQRIRQSLNRIIA